MREVLDTGRIGGQSIVGQLQPAQQESGLRIKFKGGYQDCFWEKQTHCSGSIDPRSAPETGWKFCEFFFHADQPIFTWPGFMSWRSEGAEVPDPQDPTILKNPALKIPGGEKLPEASNTKLIKCLLKKCVLQEKPVTSQEKSLIPAQKS